MLFISVTWSLSNNMYVPHTQRYRYHDTQVHFSCQTRAACNACCVSSFAIMWGRILSSDALMQAIIVIVSLFPLVRLCKHLDTFLASTVLGTCSSCSPVLSMFQMSFSLSNNPDLVNKSFSAKKYFYTLVLSLYFSFIHTHVLRLRLLFPRGGVKPFQGFVFLSISTISPTVLTSSNLLVTCYLLSSQLGSKALNADIGPIVVQPVFEHINRWSIENLLREPVPFTNWSLTEEEFSTVESASVDE